MEHPAAHYQRRPGRTALINARPRPKIASRSDIANDAEPPHRDRTAKFSWPVRGKMLAGFGSRPDGTHNDGVNLRVPQGTENPCRRKRARSPMPATSSKATATWC